MKHRAVSNGEQAQKAGNLARSRVPAPAGATGGRLAQLAGMMNGSPRIQALAQLNDGARQSAHAQTLLGLAAQINQVGDAGPEREAAGAVTGSGTGVLQGVFVYSFAHDAVHSANKDDNFYRGKGFRQYRSSDGKLVWADPRNAADVHRSVIAPDVLARESRMQRPSYNTVQDLMERAEYVDQDFGKNNYYIGTTAAYTYNLSTCTAIAIFHPPTGLSYLKHADAGTSPEQVRLSVIEYLEEASRRSPGPFSIQDLEVTIYATSGEDNRESSFENIREGIGEIPATPSSVIDLFEHAQIVEESQREHHIVVGDDMAPGVIDPGHAYSTLQYALRQIAAGKGQNGAIYGSTFAHVVESEYQHWSYDGVAALGAELIEAAAAHATGETKAILDRMAEGEGPPQEEPDWDLEAEVRRRYDVAVAEREHKQGKTMSWADMTELEDEIRAEVLKERQQAHEF